LACAFQGQGWDTTLLTYRPGSFFAPELQAAQVRHLQLQCRGYGATFLGIARAIRSLKPTVVLAFMNHCAFYVECASLVSRHRGLVVSERGFEAEKWPKWRRMLHLAADYVVTNSHTNRLRLETAIPALADRTVTIYNAVDLEKYRPASRIGTDTEPLRFLVFANHRLLKNAQRLVEAFAQARRRNRNFVARLDWYGGYPPLPSGGRDTSGRESASVLAQQLGLGDCVAFHDPIEDTVAKYQSADAVILPSLLEGLPNCVCEAMACGAPVLMSDVCDAGNLVRENANGLLFDPLSVDSIADALLRFAALPHRDRAAMGATGRQMAERMFSADNIVSAYETVLTAASAKRQSTLPHWVPEVPDSARRTGRLSRNAVLSFDLRTKPACAEVA
jgi:glycosyltransferase involved in cell wall biosynthesis